jgi:hypothetical protein
VYESGEYFSDPRRHSADAAFKAKRFLPVLRRALRTCRTPIESYADVGTGSGDAARIVAKGLPPKTGSSSSTAISLAAGKTPTW